MAGARGGEKEKRREVEGGKLVKSRPRLLTRLNPGSALKVGSGALGTSAVQGTGAQQGPGGPMDVGVVGLGGPPGTGIWCTEYHYHYVHSTTY